MPVRLAVFTLVDWSFSIVREWAESEGHEIALVVSLPGDDAAPSVQRSSASTRESVVMVVPKVTQCAATLAELDVDLSVVFTFRRVPESVASVARHGCVNLHPSLLPAYRGANGYRALYEGEPVIGATLHHLTPEFDAGAILAQASVPVPDEVEPVSALAALSSVATDVLKIGVPRALAGEPGDEQDEAAASGAPPFTEDEILLPFDLSSHVFHCRFSALTLAGKQPLVEMDGEPQPVRAVRRLGGLSAASPGIVSSGSRRAIAAVTDGVLELELGRQPF
jgi:methionyl-tRNA formyltransferase